MTNVLPWSRLYMVPPPPSLAHKGDKANSGKEGDAATKYTGRKECAPLIPDVMHRVCELTPEGRARVIHTIFQCGTNNERKEEKNNAGRRIHNSIHIASEVRVHPGHDGAEGVSVHHAHTGKDGDGDGDGVQDDADHGCSLLVPRHAATFIPLHYRDARSPSTNLLGGQGGHARFSPH